MMRRGNGPEPEKDSADSEREVEEPPAKDSCADREENERELV
jgi:hypothetical protein